MANYYGTGRTNFFKVNDTAAFKAEMSKYEVEVIEEDELVALLGLSEEGMPWEYFDEDIKNFEQIEWDEVLAKHLADDWVCVVQEVGNEKMRYVRGFAMAFNNKREVKTISLDDIYQHTLGANCRMI